MTQTQDEQNGQATGTQSTTPVADNQNVQAPTPDLSAVDLTEETPVAEQPAEAPAAEQPAEAPAAEQPAEKQ